MRTLQAYAHLLTPDDFWVRAARSLDIPDESRAFQVGAAFVNEWVGLALGQRSHSLELTITRYRRRLPAEPEKADRLIATLGFVRSSLVTDDTIWTIRGEFEYGEDFRSLIQVPVKVQTGDFTEIRGFRFAGPDYSLIVERPDPEGNFLHQVMWTDTGALTDARLGDWVARADKLSGHLVEKAGS